MRRLHFLLLMMLSLLMFSCNEKEKTLRPVSSKIDGPLGDCFEVVLRDYKIINHTVNIELLRVKEGVPESPIIAEFLDAAGNGIGTSTIDSKEDDMKYLLANKVGESSTITFKMGDVLPAQVRIISPMPTMEEAGPAITTIIVDTTEMLPVDLADEEEMPLVLESDTVVDALPETEEDPVAEGSVIDKVIDEVVDISSTISDSFDEKQWDKILDEYESYVDQYIKLMKKVSSNDITALAEYASLLEKAERLEKELEEGNNDMSAAQMQRYVKITQKLTNAALESF